MLCGCQIQYNVLREDRVFFFLIGDTKDKGMIGTEEVLLTPGILINTTNNV